ncbi:MAG: ABC transporter ATP-binding protein [Chitinophagales bacterium]
MNKQNQYGNIFDWSLLKRILGLVKPFRREFISATLLAIVLSVLGPVRPYLIQVTVDDYILKQDGKGLQMMIMILIGLLITESFLRYFFIFITNWLGQSVIKNLRVQVFSHVTRLKLQFFDKTPIGTATTRTINDVETINDIFSQGFITIIADLLTIVVVIGIMFYSNWQLTLVSLATFPLIIYSTYVFKEKIKGAFQKVRNQVSKLNAFAQEHITGMRIIQIFNAEDKEYRKFQKINAEHRDAHIQSILYYSIFFPVVEVILASAIGLMVWYGANQVIAEKATLGVLISFILYLNMLFRPLRMLADKFNTLQMGIVAGDRIFRLLDNKDFIDNSGTRETDHVKGDIHFENVSFAYNAEEYVLRDINFDLKAGETLAIVGATGSGKTSIINILSRYYEFQKGKITVDGVDIRDYKLENLRSHVGAVLQDVFLFSGSIHDNITLHNPDISRQQVIEAAKEVGAHDFIMRLPDNYDYDVMERGATLSMGQRQLISFIRALVYDPKILILDEATSSIDTESERLVQKAIERLIQGRTSITIAHRLSTIKHAHKILVLKAGEIIEAGTHQELMAQNGHFKKLHDMQFSEGEVGV